MKRTRSSSDSPEKEARSRAKRSSRVEPQQEEDYPHSYYPASLLIAMTWFVFTAILLWCHILPSATEWWTTEQGAVAPKTTTKTQQQTAAALPGGYRSVAEMEARATRFPSIDQRVRVYMTNWYAPPCRTDNKNKNSTTSAAGAEPDDTAVVQYHYLRDDKDPAASPLLALQELKIPAHLLKQDDDNDDDDDDNTDEPTDRKMRRVFAHSGNNRTFLLDSTCIVKGARLFYMTADTIRQCDKTFCLDFVKFIFPSLHRADMSVDVGRQNKKAAATAYPGNALDATDANTNAIVPVLLQFGDLEISRAYVVTTGQNETYPVLPAMKKFRWSLSREELDRVTSADPCEWDHRPIPTTRSGDQRIQPIISKLTYQRHFGMLDEIPLNDIPWSEKKNAAIWRGALTGMKRAGFRVFQESLKDASKYSMCQNLQRCRLVYNYANSSLVNASITGVLMYHPHNMIEGPVIPEVLNGVRLYGSRLSYDVLLQYKALIMLEGNDISSGLKWALYSKSVVLAQVSLYTSWAMEELLEPWVHFVPLADDLSDVHEKMQWILDNDEEAQKIAHAGTLWISDLIFHPDAASDEEAVFDETFIRYKQHFVHSPDLAVERLIQQEE